MDLMRASLRCAIATIVVSGVGLTGSIAAASSIDSGQAASSKPSRVQFVSTYTRLCLEVGKTKMVSQGGCGAERTENQWFLIPAPGGSAFYLRHRNAGLCLAPGNKTKPNTYAVKAAGCSKTKSQLWAKRSGSRLWNAATGLCLVGGYYEPSPTTFLGKCDKRDNTRKWTQRTY